MSLCLYWQRFQQLKTETVQVVGSGIWSVTPQRTTKGRIGQDFFDSSCLCFHLPSHPWGAASIWEEGSCKGTHKTKWPKWPKWPKLRNKLWKKNNRDDTGVYPIAPFSLKVLRSLSWYLADYDLGPSWNYYTILIYIYICLSIYHWYHVTWTDNGGHFELFQIRMYAVGVSP